MNWVTCIVLGLLLTGCAKQTAQSNETNQTTFDFFQSGWLPSAPADTNTIDKSTDSISNDTASNIIEINMTAQQWSFSPSEIRVHQGDHVIIHVTATDVAHGLRIFNYGVGADLQPGETKTVDFIADKTGKFEYYCSVYCGAGHKSMYGWLIVE